MLLRARARQRARTEEGTGTHREESRLHHPPAAATGAATEEADVI